MLNLNFFLQVFGSLLCGAYSVIFYLLDPDLPCGSGSRRAPIMRIFVDPDPHYWLLYPWRVVCRYYGRPESGLPTRLVHADFNDENLEETSRYVSHAGKCNFLGRYFLFFIQFYFTLVPMLCGWATKILPVLWLCFQSWLLTSVTTPRRTGGDDYDCSVQEKANTVKS